MPDPSSRLNAADVQAFLSGRLIYVFDPASHAQVATVRYDVDGTCETQFTNGGRDPGVWGLEGDTYWTQYKTFRDGSRNAFYLHWTGTDVVQAYHADGRQAFVQSRSPATPARAAK